MNKQIVTKFRDQIKPDPFGMITYGRSWQVGNDYRYGFNGKEQDDETSGNGNEYDYGFRIYNPRLGKFLSKDPISRYYPMLSPYQFASNKPISGVDLDGLEWVHYYVYLNKNHQVIKKVIHEDFRYETESKMDEIHGMEPGTFYDKYSKGFGPEGKGVLYTYFVEDENGKYSQYGEPQWEVKDQNILGKGTIFRHGMFYGSGCVTKAGPLFEAGFGKYDFSVKPNDMTDAIARLHDIGEDEPNYKSWKNTRYIFNDIDFVKRLDVFISGVENGTITIDPYTGRPPSTEALEAAIIAKAYFTVKINDKMHKMANKYYEGKITLEDYQSFLQQVKNQWSKETSLPQPTNESENYTK